jgi:hypothetical protein
VDGDNFKVAKEGRRAGTEELTLLDEVEANRNAVTCVCTVRRGEVEKDDGIMARQCI